MNSNVCSSYEDGINCLGFEDSEICSRCPCKKTIGKFPNLSQPPELHTTSAFEKQVGGTHYNSLVIQPLQLTLLNMGYDAFKGACYTKVNKYMIRKKDNEVEQLKKARHILDLWIEEAEKRQ